MSLISISGLPVKISSDWPLAFSVIPDGEQGAVLSTALDLSTFEAHLWEAANIQVSDSQWTDATIIETFRLPKTQVRNDYTSFW